MRTRIMLRYGGCYSAL